MESSQWTRRALIRTAAAAGALGVLSGEAAPAAAREHPHGFTPDELAAIDHAIGKKGTMLSEQGVYTIPLPRNDLHVRIHDEPVPVPFGFGGWVSFKKTRDGKATMVMSDAVLLPEEVNPVISAAQEHGIEVSAIHNHFFFEEPRVVYMHLHAMGEPGDLARAYSAAIKPSRLHPANQPAPAESTARGAKDHFDLDALDRITGHQGVANGPVYKYTVGRPDLTVTLMGVELTAGIGLNSWAAFTGTTEHALVAGDIAMLEPEVTPVIAVLRRHGLEVVAVHSHMLGEEPRIVFLHYMGSGTASALARGFREALDQLGRHGRSYRMMSNAPAHPHHAGH
jgi:hypothetical protein